MSLPSQSFIKVNQAGYVIQTGNTDLDAFHRPGSALYADAIPVEDDEHYHVGDHVDPVTGMVTLYEAPKLEGTTITSLPIPCRVVVNYLQTDEQTYEVDDGVAELEFTHPGAYTIFVESACPINSTFTITQP